MGGNGGVVTLKSQKLKRGRSERECDESEILNFGIILLHTSNIFLRDDQTLTPPPPDP